MHATGKCAASVLGAPIERPPDGPHERARPTKRVAYSVERGIHYLVNGQRMGRTAGYWRGVEPNGMHGASAEIGRSNCGLGI